MVKKSTRPLLLVTLKKIKFLSVILILFFLCEPILVLATSVRSSSANGASAGTAITVSAPSGTTAGDVVIVLVHVNGQTTLVDNNGSTPFTEDIDDSKPNPLQGHTVSIFSRRIQSGDPTTYAFTSGVSGRWAATAITISEPNASTIYDVAPNTSGGRTNEDDTSSTTMGTPSITTLTDGAINIIAVFWDANTITGTHTPPSGWTSLANYTGSVTEPITSSYKVITPAGSTGAQTDTNSNGSLARQAFSFAIKPAATVTTARLIRLKNARLKNARLR